MAHKKPKKNQKQRTNKAAKKRFKITATGKIMFWPAGRKHLMSAKKAKRRRQSRRWCQLTSPSDAKKMGKIMAAGRLRGQQSGTETAAAAAVTHAHEPKPVQEPKKG